MTKNRYEAARAALEPSVLLEQLRDMGDIGLTRPGDRDSGRTRMALDDGDRDGRDRLTAWMRELDLDVRVDGIGNIFGLLPGAADLPPLPDAAATAPNLVLTAPACYEADPERIRAEGCVLSIREIV